jgi:hypothetical protein
MAKNTEQTTAPAAPKNKKTRTPKVISPEVEALREEYRKKIAALAGDRASAAILQTIITKRLPSLTKAHQQALFDHLAVTCQPALINVPSAAQEA